MTDLFLDPKVLNFSADRYELILLALRRARQVKAKNAPEPMQELIERALKDIVEGRVTREEIMTQKVPVLEPAAEAPLTGAALVTIDGEEKTTAKASASGDEENGKKTKKAKAKKKK